MGLYFAKNNITKIINPNNESILHKKYPSGVPAGEKQKAYGFLMRKGFSYDAAEHALNAAAIDR